MSLLLKAENISHFFDKRKPILNNISFELNRGEILGIAGESGSGKTTLGKIIAGLITPSDGKIIFTQTSGWEKTRVSPIQMLFQNNGEILNPFRRIDSVVKEALAGNLCRCGTYTQHIKAVMEAAAILRGGK